MATSKTKKTSNKTEKTEVESSETKASEAVSAPSEESKVETAKKDVVEKKEEPKEVKTPVKQEKKALTFKHEVGDKVKFSGEEWKVLIVVNKKDKERLRIGKEGSLKAVWAEDLD